MSEEAQGSQAASAEPARLSFPESAQSGLDAAAGGIASAKREAESGDLEVDQEAGHTMLAELTAVKSRVTDLIGQCAELHQPLKFGDNWVGQAMNQRLTEAAQGQPRAFVPVLQEFEAVLTDLQRMVKYAAGLYEDIDGQAAEELRRSLRALDVPMDSEQNGAVR